MLGWVNTSCAPCQPSVILTTAYIDTYVDRWVVGHRLPDGQVDPLALRGKVRRRLGVALHCLEHVRWADTALEEHTRGAEGTTREDDTAIRVQGHDAVRSEGIVVRAHAEDRRTVADDLGDEHIVLVHEVLARERGLEVRRDGASALAVEEVERAEPEHVVLRVRVVVDRDLRVALSSEQLLDDGRGLLEVTLAVGRGVVRARKALLQLVGERLVVAPAARPSARSGEVAGVGVPVETVEAALESPASALGKRTYAPLTEVPPPRRQPAKKLVSRRLLQ